MLKTLAKNTYYIAFREFAPKKSKDTLHILLVNLVFKAYTRNLEELDI